MPKQAYHGGDKEGPGDCVNSPGVWSNLDERSDAMHSNHAPMTGVNQWQI